MLCEVCSGTGEVTWYIRSEHNYPPGTPPDVRCPCRECDGKGFLLVEDDEEEREKEQHASD